MATCLSALRQDSWERVRPGAEADICLKGEESPNEIIGLWNILLGGFPALKYPDNAMSGCRHRCRYVVFLGQWSQRSLSDRTDKNKPTVSDVGPVAPQSARMESRDNGGTRSGRCFDYQFSTDKRKEKHLQVLKSYNYNSKGFFKKKKKNYIQTLNTSLPHHIAQILKWQFVLALSAPSVYINKQ